MSLQFDLGNEIYVFTGTKPRFPDPIPTPEKISQMELTSLFFELAPSQAQITDIAKAQFLVSALGAVHAVSNPLSFWQSMKAAFSFCGNRKGQLTSKLNQRIFLAIEKACAPEITETVKEHVRSRSKQVQSGIRSQPGKSPKCFSGFGKTELVRFADVTAIEVHDLAALQPVSVAMNLAMLEGHRDTYRVHRHATETLRKHAEVQIQTMVNAED
jgi:hypothetical protein